MKKKKTATIVSYVTTWILRIVVVVTILFFLIVTLAAVLSGNGPAQKAALEQVFAGLFQQETRIQKLNTYEFFPILKANFDNLVVLGPDRAEPLIILEHVDYAQDSISRFMGKEPLRVADFKNFLTSPGFFGPYSIHLSEGGIDPNPDQKTGPHTARARGNYGGYDLELEFPLNGRQYSDMVQYQFVGTEPIRLTLDRLRADIVLQVQGNTMIFDPVIIRGKTALLNATLVVRRGKEQVKPVLKLTDVVSGLTIEGEFIEFGKLISFKGRAFGDAVNVADLRAKTSAMVEIIGGMVKTIETSRQKMSNGQMILPGKMNVDLAIDIKKLDTCRVFTNLTGQFQYADRTMVLSDLKWQIDGHAYTGMARGTPLKLQAQHDEKTDPALTRCLD